MASPTRLSLALAALALAGCAPHDPIAASADPIIDGTPVANAATSGIIHVDSNGWLCSGTMLTPSWALTAAHCRIDTANPKNIVVRLGNDGAPDQQVAHGEYAVQHPSLDFALIHLDHRFAGIGDIGMFTVDPYELRQLPLVAYGYSDNACQGESCTGYGTLRSAPMIPDGTFDEYNFNGGNATGQYAAEGDSGMPAVLDSPAGRTLAGVMKQWANFGDTANFREWALSYLFDRDVALPTVWFLPFDPHPYLQARPLEDDWSNTHTWTPCPNVGSYWWHATWSLDPSATIVVSSGQGATTLSGTGAMDRLASGPLTVAYTTGTQAVRSPGLTSLSVSCGLGVRYAPDIRLGGSARVDHWDPCPGSANWTWEGQAALAGDDTIQIGSFGELYVGQQHNAGQASGPVEVSFSSDQALAGLELLTARCGGSAIQCLGPECFTSWPLQASTSTSRTWTPCNGRAFRWRADTAFAAGDSLHVHGDDGTDETIAGNRVSSWVDSSGTLTLDLQSGATGGGVLHALTATCLDWKTPARSGIHVVEGTYGANCGGNPGNETDKLSAVCEGRSSCRYVVDYTVIGDPVPGCAKDYVARWSCDDDPHVYRAALAAEAGFGSAATLSCDPAQGGCFAQCDAEFEDCVDTAPPGGARACRTVLTSCQAKCRCVKTTCAQANAACGSIPDGCGGTLGCGGCASGAVCLSTNQCCQPIKSCGGRCGSIADGCGGTLACGPCHCTPTCAGKRCGAGDGCGGQCSGYCPKAGTACMDDGNGPYCGFID